MTAAQTVHLVEQAIDVLRKGGVAALPTDTLYALAAAANDAVAVRRVFEIKGRESAKALPLFVADLAMAERVGSFNEAERRLARQFWPGALTIVLPKQPEFESEALAGGTTVALRVPASETMLAVVRGLDAPVTATSANRSGGPDPVTADEVRSQLGAAIDFVLDAGTCPIGVSSTIVDCTDGNAKILRLGAISEQAILRALA